MDKKDIICLVSICLFLCLYLYAVFYGNNKKHEHMTDGEGIAVLASAYNSGQANLTNLKVTGKT